MSHHISRLFFRLILFAAIVCVLCTAFVLAADFFVRHNSADAFLTETEARTKSFDCILVLGAGVRGGEPSPLLAERLDMGISLFQAGVSDRILVSGDHGQKDYDEVNVMKSYAVTRGVNSEAVFMDHAGFSTYESMYRAKEIFGVKRVLIVTQEYHLSRAIYDARAMGMETYGVSADKTRMAGQLSRDFREIFARAKDVIYCAVKPKPTYLGEAIPIGGNGNVTNDL